MNIEKVLKLGILTTAIFAGTLVTPLLTQLAYAHHTPVSRGQGGDIIIFDIVDSATEAPQNGGGDNDGGGGDIIVWDIVDSVADEPQEADGESIDEVVAEEEEAEAPVGTPEYKYVPVRRY